MTESPLPKPAHLADVPRRVAGIVALALGAVAFAVVAATQDHFWATPDWRVSVPGFAATAAAAAVSLVRRERAHAWWLGGLGLAGAALVLGWFMMLAIVIGVTALLIAILHHVM